MMDGKKNRPKLVERLTEINKLWNVPSCWLYFANRLNYALCQNVFTSDAKENEMISIL